MSFRVIVVLLSIISVGCTQQDSPDRPKPKIVYKEPDPSVPIPAPRPVPRPGFVNLDLLEDTMLFDLQTLEANERLNTRYIIGCDRHNKGADLDLYEQGLNLAFNRLSSERFLQPVKAIGAADCIFRIDLRDYTITRFEWQLIEAATILDFETNSVRGNTLKFLAQARKPYIFGIETCVMFECDATVDVGGDLYYDLIDVPNVLADYYAQQGVDVQVEVDNEQAIFSGFSQSLISLGKERLVQVVESDFGYCLQTFDTALGGDNLFLNSFTIELIQARGILNSDKLFKHDASEVICTALNGLTIWGLHDAAGLGASAAPTNIVGNNRTPNLDSAIRIGDCGNCHFPEIIIPFSDQLNAHILGNSAYDDKEKDLANTYIRYDRMAAVISDINNRNALALTELGVFANIDPLANVVFNDIREELTADDVASYTLLQTDVFLKLLTGTAISSQVFGNLLNGGTVNINTIKENFNILVQELNLYEDLN